MAILPTQATTEWVRTAAPGTGAASAGAGLGSGRTSADTGHGTDGTFILLFADTDGEIFPVSDKGHKGYAGKYPKLVVFHLESVIQALLGEIIKSGNHHARFSLGETLLLNLLRMVCFSL